LAAKAGGMAKDLALVELETGRMNLVTVKGSLFTPLGLVTIEEKDIVYYSLESGNYPKEIFAAGINYRNHSLENPVLVVDANSWLKSNDLAKSVIFTYASSKGDALEAQLFLPANFNRTKPEKLPLVVIPYGGYINEFPKSGYFLTMGVEVLTSLGYAVAFPNTHGISSEDQTDEYGKLQLADTGLMLDELIKEGIINGQKIAVMGHSHGGAMAYYYLTHSKRFCAVIAINGAADWIMQAELERMTGLPGAMNGVPKDIPQKYKEYSPLLNIENVNAPLLAVSGEKDSQVVPQNARSIVEALKAAGKQAELLSFKDEGHLINSPENRKTFWDKVFLLLKEAFK